MQIGDNCPTFQLIDQNGRTVLSDDFKGKKTVIYFYPKDDTPGCTKEACAFRDSYEDFLEYDCQVIGISSDTEEKHLQFAQKHRLPFTLLADSDGKIRKLFNVPTSLFGLLPGRVTYIFDENSTLIGVFNSQLNPLGHVKEALKMVKATQKK